jgi:hypothetical protein
VESERINYLLTNISKATQEDITLLENEINKSPYSQLLHILLAKIQYQKDGKEKNRKLSTAAIYSSDRSILKMVIQEKDYLGNLQEITPYQNLIVEEEEDVLIITDSDEEHESSSIFDEVLRNLEKLKALRQQFQFLELNEQESPNQESIKKETRPKAKKTEKEKSKQTKSEKSELSDSKKIKMDQIAEKDLILDNQVNEYFLKEIKKNKEGIVQEIEEKGSDQNLIIEKFIEEQPSIGSFKKEGDKSPEEINKDLSVNSTKFGDDLVSENLAIILLKQGKKERSIDIYKKLIWKLPQKKAYFAARIEEIKK